MKKLLITSTAVVMLSMATGVFAADTKSNTAVSGSATAPVPGKTTVEGGADGGAKVPFKSDRPNKVDARNQNNTQ